MKLEHLEARVFVPNRFVIRVSSAKMPRSCKGIYKNIAVIETTDGEVPSMISERARNVIRIVQRYGPLYVGSTEGCQFAIALRKAKELQERLNGE